MEDSPQESGIRSRVVVVVEKLSMHTFCPSRSTSNIEDASGRVISLIILVLEGSMSVKGALLGRIVVVGGYISTKEVGAGRTINTNRPEYCGGSKYN